MALLTVVAVAPAEASAQDLLRHLARTDPANAAAWLEPFADGVATGLTAGFFTAGGRGSPFRLGVRYTASPLSGAAGTFVPRLPEALIYRDVAFFDPYGVVGDADTSPTVAGRGEGAVLTPQGTFREALARAGEDPEAHRLVLPPGLGLDAARIPVVEAALGLRGLGVQFVGRFFPTVELTPEVGHLRAFGGGVLVTVSRFAGIDVVDVGLSAVTQKVDAGDYLDASGSALGVVVSRDVGGLRAYATGTLVSARVDVRYATVNPSELPGLPPHGSSQTFGYSLGAEARAALGVVVTARAVVLSAEYSPASPDLLSVSLALGGR